MAAPRASAPTSTACAAPSTSTAPSTTRPTPTAPGASRSPSPGTGSPGSAAFKRDPQLAARDALMEVYHHQRAFYQQHKRYAASRDELGMGENSVEWKMTADGYVASVGAGSGVLHVRQDSKIWDE